MLSPRFPRRTGSHLRISALLQLWLDNQSTVAAVSSVYARVLAAASGLRNAFFGQTRSRARLNAIASYDQSNELFKVRPRASAPLFPATHSYGMHPF